MILKWIKNKLVDIIVTIALIILISTTLLLNIYAGLYLLSFVFIGIAIIIARYR